MAYEHKQLDKPAKNMFLLAKFFQIIAQLGIVILDAANSLLFVSYTFEVIALLSLKNLLKEEVDYAHFDDLTDVLNRCSFNKETEKKLLQYAKKREPIHYILFDVDYFKSVNDTYRHLIGDKVLQYLTTIKTFLQPHDLFGRYGDNEFAILLTNKNEQQAIETIEKIKKAIQPLSVDDVVVTYSISIGIITTVPTATTHLETLYTSCDHALYEAKKNGRNIFVKGTIDS